MRSNSNSGKKRKDIISRILILQQFQTLFLILQIFKYSGSFSLLFIFGCEMFFAGLSGTYCNRTR